jgi:hypothetical protein
LEGYKARRLCCREAIKSGRPGNQEAGKRFYPLRRILLTEGAHSAIPRDEHYTGVSFKKEIEVIFSLSLNMV